MNNKRKSVKMPDVTMSHQEAEELLAVYARCDASIAKINAEMDLQITKIRESKAEKLAALNQELEEAYNKLMIYCSNNRALFADRKSIEMSHGEMGFRTGTPKVKNLKGFTWAAVLELAKENAPGYVRTIEELNKEALLLDRDLPETNEVMKKIKVTVVQEETYFIKLKKEETQPV